jgi:hypothetical protein
VATKLRSSVFHPTRTGISFRDDSAHAVPLTFKSIFGRHTLLTGETGEFQDLIPLNNTGDSINQASVNWNSSYTNGKYTITDPHNLKQRIKRYDRFDRLGNHLDPWTVKVVSMSASITSLKVIWKHVSRLFSRPFPAAPFFPPAPIPLLSPDLSTPYPFLSARNNPERSQAGFRANTAAAAYVFERQLHIATSNRRGEHAALALILHQGLGSVSAAFVAHPVAGVVFSLPK